MQAPAPSSIFLPCWHAGTFPPGWKDGNAGTFRCGHHHLQAHAHAVKLYRDKYRASQGGKLSITVSHSEA